MCAYPTPYEDQKSEFRRKTHIVEKPSFESSLPTETELTTGFKEPKPTSNAGRARSRNLEEACNQNPLATFIARLRKLALETRKAQSSSASILEDIRTDLLNCRVFLEEERQLRERVYQIVQEMPKGVESNYNPARQFVQTGSSEADILKNLEGLLASSKPLFAGAGEAQQLAKFLELVRDKVFVSQHGVVKKQSQFLLISQQHQSIGKGSPSFSSRNESKSSESSRSRSSSSSSDEANASFDSDSDSPMASWPKNKSVFSRGEVLDNVHTPKLMDEVRLKNNALPLSPVVRTKSLNIELRRMQFTAPRLKSEGSSLRSLDARSQNQETPMAKLPQRRNFGNFDFTLEEWARCLELNFEYINRIEKSEQSLQKLITSTQTQASSLLAITNELLDIQRSPGESLGNQFFDFEAVLKQVVEDKQGSFDEIELKILPEHSSKLASVYNDPAKVKQALTSLFQEIQDFRSEKQWIAVEVEGVEAEAPGDLASLPYITSKEVSSLKSLSTVLNRIQINIQSSAREFCSTRGQGCSDNRSTRNSKQVADLEETSSAACLEQKDDPASSPSPASRLIQAIGGAIEQEARDPSRTVVLQQLAASEPTKLLSVHSPSGSSSLTELFRSLQEQATTMASSQGTTGEQQPCSKFLQVPAQGLKKARQLNCVRNACATSKDIGIFRHFDLKSEENANGSQSAAFFKGEQSAGNGPSTAFRPAFPKIVSRADLSSLQVLIAHHNPMQLYMIREMLKSKFGITNTLSVQSGKIAVSKMMIKPYDIAFLEVKMPDMDGLKQATSIRMIMKKPPVLVGLADKALSDERREECQAAGLKHMIKWPTSSEKQLREVFTQAFP